jgi:hypothetical protein
LHGLCCTGGPVTLSRLLLQRLLLVARQTPESCCTSVQLCAAVAAAAAAAAVGVHRCAAFCEVILVGHLMHTGCQDHLQAVARLLLLLLLLQAALWRPQPHPWTGPPKQQRQTQQRESALQRHLAEV